MRHASSSAPAESSSLLDNALLAREMMAAFDLSHGFIRKLNGEIVLWTKGSERLYGWTKQQAEGQISHNLLRTHFPRPLQELEAELLEKGSWQGELSHSASFGSRLHVASSWVLKRDAQGKPLLVIEVNNDITDRVASWSLASRLAAIVESSDDAIIGTSLDGRIESWNRGAEKLFGYAANEIIGEPIRRLIPEDGRAEGEKVWSRIAQGERIEHFDTVRLTKTNERLLVSLTISPIYDKSGHLAGVSKTARDITARYRMEQALRSTNQALEQFAYAAAHDLQEPLRTVALSLQLAKVQNRSMSEDCGKLIDSAIESARRMAAMVKDLLVFSRITAVEGELTESLRADANTVLRTVEENLQSALRETGAVISVERHLPVVAVGEIHLQQVLQNIIENAIKYRSERVPAIKVSAAQRQGRWYFSVTDNGIGIPEAYQRRVFGVFKRLAAANIPGTGVGLALCKRIIEHYGGEIEIKSNRNGGVTVFFSVPACVEAFV